MTALGIDLTFSDTTSKYHNTRATYRGEQYDSAGEAAYAAKLDLRCKSGELIDWERPGPMILVDGDKPRDRITYKPDFYVIPAEGNSFFVDFKGSRITETEAWRLKVKLWKKAISFELRVAYPSGEEKVVAPARALSISTEEVVKIETARGITA
jgi:hypothetical protein